MVIGLYDEALGKSVPGRQIAIFPKHHEVHHVLTLIILAVHFAIVRFDNFKAFLGTPSHRCTTLVVLTRFRAHLRPGLRVFFDITFLRFHRLLFFLKRWWLYQLWANLFSCIRISQSLNCYRIDSLQIEQGRPVIFHWYVVSILAKIMATDSRTFQFRRSVRFAELLPWTQNIFSDRFSLHSSIL